MSNAPKPWIKYLKAIGITEISPLGESVAQLIDRCWSGIYHLHSKHLLAIDWSNTYNIEMRIDFESSLSTVDGNRLTMLVVRSHDLMLRFEIEPRSNRTMTARFHRRTTRTGRLMERIPTIDKHIKQIRAYTENRIN